MTNFIVHFRCRPYSFRGYHNKCVVAPGRSFADAVDRLYKRYEYVIAPYLLDAHGERLYLDKRSTK